ncbi:unnamed protein product [Rhizoctonia solani]|uniref:Zn(2)-C6 fungal-type domain-containing protein n=1 Tax=Rhizoctonia solani TaxID=456999 RepID=A0A8H3BK62_9AGAM|nr:unnamed protein product [Rhizoctonia solani]
MYQAHLHLPLSTVASAAHSQSQQQATINNTNCGLFEPVAGDAGNSKFSANLPGQSTPQSQRQQVPGDFIPGAGVETNEWYQQQNSTLHSDYSELSAAQLSSAVRDTSNQQSFSFPVNPNNTFGSPAGFHQLYYPDRYLPGFDFPGSTEQYTSPALSTDKHYMSSPEQLQYYQTQHIFSATSQAPLLRGQNITAGQEAPLAIASPIKITSQQSAGFNTGWGAVDTNAVAPDSGESVGPRRLPGACSNCKRLKMKCTYEDGADICKRCKQADKLCVIEGRKRGPGPNKRELLMREIASKDQIIDSLLRQIHNPAMCAPIDWPPTVPTSHQPTNTDRPLDQDVASRTESIRQYKSLTPTGSIETRNNQGHLPVPSEPIASSTNVRPDDNAVSFEKGASDVKDKDAGRSLTPAELKLHSIPDDTTTVGLIAKLSLRANRDKGGSDAGMTGDAEEEDSWVQLGNMSCFEAGPSMNPGLRQMSPEIFTRGIIKPNEVEILFKIFFEELNPFVAILDPHIHTPAFVFDRCPFLFTAICAISSRYYTKRPELYSIAMHFAKQSAAMALIDGWKSVELIQAYILMSVYPAPARLWEEDRTGLYLGLAIRMATDLKLHLPGQGKAAGEAHEREILNRTRTWLVCFNLDRSGATQLGQPPTIQENYIVRHSGDWYKRSNLNLPFDIHVTTNTRLLRIVTRFLASVYSNSNSPTALNKNVDFLMLCTQTDEELTTFEHETQEQFEKESNHRDSACRYRCDFLPFLSNYSRVVIFSFGLQQASQRGLEMGKIFFNKCYKAACEVIRIAIEVLAPSGRLKHAPDGHFMLSPQFAAAYERSQSQHTISLVTRLTKVLSSSEVSIDDRHSPRLYSRLLTSLVQKHIQELMVLAPPSNANANGGAATSGLAPGPSVTQSNGKGPANGGPQRSNPFVAGLMHEYLPSGNSPSPFEADKASDQIGVAPLVRIKSPPIVIHSPTIDQSMQTVGLNGAGHHRSLSDGQRPASNDITGGYFMVKPSGDTLPPMAGTGQGETITTDVRSNLEFENDHDMLAAMAAIQDPQWWDTRLLPGWNANFADDGSSSSSETRNARDGDGSYDDWVLVVDDRE